MSPCEMARPMSKPGRGLASTPRAASVIGAFFEIPRSLARWLISWRPTDRRPGPAGRSFALAERSQFDRDEGGEFLDQGVGFLDGVQSLGVFTTVVGGR